MKYIILIITSLLISCGSQPKNKDYYNLASKLDDVISYDRTKPRDIKNITNTLPIFEVRSANNQVDFKQGIIHSNGSRYYLEGDGAQPPVTIDLLDSDIKDPIRIRLILGNSISGNISVYIYERITGGWKLIKTL